MAHCTNCGTQIPGGVNFCPTCGAPAPTDGQTAYQAPVMQPPSAASDAQNNKVMGILAYLGILVLVPIFAAKESKFARFHANQGLVLAIIELVFMIIQSILAGILTSLMFSTGSWGLLGIISTLLGLLWIVFLVLSIIGIINAANGRMKELPIIGKITILK